MGMSETILGSPISLIISYWLQGLIITSNIMKKNFKHGMIAQAEVTNMPLAPQRIDQVWPKMTGISMTVCYRRRRTKIKIH